MLQSLVWWQYLIVTWIVTILMVLAVWLKSRAAKFERKIFDEATLLAQFERQLLTKADPPFPPIEWLERRIDVDEIEKYFEKYPRWERAFKTRMTDGDELWEFCSPAQSWEDLGSGGSGSCARWSSDCTCRHSDELTDTAEEVELLKISLEGIVQWRKCTTVGDAGWKCQCWKRMSGNSIATFSQRQGSKESAGAI
jgi:hypothetical protein